MKQVYKELKLKKASLDMIVKINAVLDDYESQGYVLTLRQLYYQLVTMNEIPNHIREYKRLGSLVSDGRIAGLIDWDMIEDRTRGFSGKPSWTSPKQILEASAARFHMNMWTEQANRVYLVVEKDALVNVIKRACGSLDVPYMAARGYPSISVIREFAQNQMIPDQQSHNNVILHIGDHDPSGIDMSRDLEERLKTFSEGVPFEFKRLALNMDQVESQKLPPNPAKSDDTRFADYKKKYGKNSWELDSLKPAYLEQLIANSIMPYIDMEIWSAREEEIKAAKAKLLTVATEFEK